jgi:chromosomal replication initiation ATPase DnaA
MTCLATAIQRARMAKPLRRPVSRVLYDVSYDEVFGPPWKPVSTFARILRAVCRHYDLTPDHLLGPAKVHRISRPRWLVMYLAREMTTLSFTQIANRLRKDHTSVIHGYYAVKERIEAGDEQTISAIAAIRAALGELAGSRQADHG